ncbi:MAG: GDP-mannose 4,6-dehydratase [Candidatus Sifarchaeia archaeon]
MNLENSSVLVTGAGGFIGSHLVENLVSIGSSVRAFVRYTSGGNIGNLQYIDSSSNNLEIFMGDLKDPYACKQAMEGVDYVFHLASVVSVPYSYINPREYFQNNVFFILNILQAAMELGTKAIIHTSTSEVYGSAEKVPISETHPLKAQSPYAASKIAADKVAESFYRSFDCPVIIIRPFNTYGPRQSVRAVIPTIISQALSQKAILLGDTRPTRDFLNVRDTIEGFIQAARNAAKAKGMVINLGTGREISIGEIATRIRDIIGTSSEVVFDASRIRPEKSEVSRLCADASLAKKVLNWEAKTSLEDGLKECIEWYRNMLSSDKPPQSYV